MICINFAEVKLRQKFLQFIINALKVIECVPLIAPPFRHGLRRIGVNAIRRD